MKAGLIIVDVQVDFTTGSLAVPFGKTIVPLVNALIDEFKKRDLPIIFTRDYHPENHCSFIENGGEWPTHCVEGTEGEFFDPDLNVDRGYTPYSHEYHILKGQDPNKEEYSGFTDEVKKILEDEGVDTVYICGLALDYCVYETWVESTSISYIIIDATKAVMNDQERYEECKNDLDGFEVFSWEVLRDLEQNQVSD